MPTTITPTIPPEKVWKNNGIKRSKTSQSKSKLIHNNKLITKPQDIHIIMANTF